MSKIKLPLPKPKPRFIRRSIKPPPQMSKLRLLQPKLKSKPKTPRSTFRLP
jgi:hypothetical protein